MTKEEKTHLAQEIENTHIRARYDRCAKRLLADKQVLARIAKYCVREFKDYDIPTIIGCIEGEPEISTHNLHPGKRPFEVIAGMNNESKSETEGDVSFDIRFYMQTPDEERVKILLNLEAQKSYYTGYDFEPRAIYYVSRMISEQHGREFDHDHYEDLKKVYSIWLFFETPQKDGDSITEYSLEQHDVYGKPVVGGGYDYLSIVFIRLQAEGQEESKHRLINMLSILFSDRIEAEEKKKRLEAEHGMTMSRRLEGEVQKVCNLGQGLWERAEREGMQQGFTRGEQQKLLGQIQKKLAKGKSIEQIADEVEESVDRVKELMEKLEVDA